MDGNRRWARERGLPVLAGHKKVADDILIPLVEYASKREISFITFWAFSTENWKRDNKEVRGIMEIFRHILKMKWKRLDEKGVRIKVIGDISKFSDDIKESLVAVEDQTKNNKKITAVFALNYGGRDEIIRAANKAFSYQLSDIRQKKQNVVSEDWRLTTDDFSQFLDTKEIPDPDIIVRTGGEQRLSGFLPWQGVYSELYFPSWYMPEFDHEKLDEVIEEYGKRQRRFGK